MTNDITIAELIRSGEAKLKSISQTPFLDAEILFGFVSGFSRVRIVAESNAWVAEDLQEAFLKLIERRVNLEPIAYIIGEKEFWSLPFKVTPDVLIPRPETEILIEEIFKVIPNFSGDNLSVVDIGTGSGCISIALAVEAKKRGINIKIIATDISLHALDIAKENAAKHQVSDLVTFREGDFFSPLSDLKGSVDIIVSNPPYIRHGDSEVDRGTHTYEPHQALYAEDEGLFYVTRLMEEFPSFHGKKGVLLFEFGSRQEEMIRSRASALFDARYKVDFLRDYAGLPRVCTVSHNM